MLSIDYHAPQHQNRQKQKTSHSDLQVRSAGLVLSTSSDFRTIVARNFCQGRKVDLIVAQNITWWSCCHYHWQPIIARNFGQGRKDQNILIVAWNNCHKCQLIAMRKKIITIELLLETCWNFSITFLNTLILEIIAPYDNHKLWFWRGLGNANQLCPRGSGFKDHHTPRQGFVAFSTFHQQGGRFHPISERRSTTPSPHHLVHHHHHPAGVSPDWWTLLVCPQLQSPWFFPIIQCTIGEIHSTYFFITCSFLTVEVKRYFPKLHFVFVNWIDLKTSENLTQNGLELSQLFVADLRPVVICSLPGYGFPKRIIASMAA